MPGGSGKEPGMQTVGGKLSSGADYGRTTHHVGSTTKHTPTHVEKGKRPDGPKATPSKGNVFTRWRDSYNLKQRTKFAQKEGLNREWAMSQQGRSLKQTKSHHGIKSTGTTLDVMSQPGKDYLKEAGYGPFQDDRHSPTNQGGDQRCPDGSMPPCPPVATPAPATTTTTTPTNTSWQFYPTNSNYITGEGYDEGGGVKFGPPPKKGPNPQVPPVKFSRGGGCAVKGTKFSGVK